MSYLMPSLEYYNTVIAVLATYYLGTNFYIYLLYTLKHMSYIIIAAIYWIKYSIKFLDNECQKLSGKL